MLPRTPKYVDYAEYYDYEYIDPMMMKDVPFYLNYVKEIGGPILELACGTSRVLIPIAEAGYIIHGLDLSQNMLDVARHKIEDKKLTIE